MDRPNTTFRAMGAVSMLIAGILAATMAMPVQVSAQGNSMLKQFESAFVDLVEEVKPAVVRIESTVQIAQTQRPDLPFDEDMLRRFFGFEMPDEEQQPRERESGGSGFIISKDGYILTNHHVIADTSEIQVTLADGRQYDAEVVGSDSDFDVGLIKIDADDLPSVELGDSEQIQEGQLVVAIGNPFGLSHTITSGIVSAQDRSFGIAEFENFIQTDAAINPGNSGGPLVNTDGKVIGINTAIFTRTGGSMGIGFAIPINHAETIYNKLIESGTVKKGFIGIGIQPLTSDLARGFGVPLTDGVVVSEVVPGSPGEEAGLQPGDIIQTLNGEKTSSYLDFRSKVALMGPNTTIELGILRDDEKMTVEVTLGERPADGESGEPTTTPMEEELGISVQNLNSQLAEQLGYEEDMSGVVITEVKPDSTAAEEGLRPGDLIREINRETVANLEDYNRLVEEGKEEGRMLLRVTSRMPDDSMATRYVSLDVSSEN